MSTPQISTSARRSWQRWEVTSEQVGILKLMKLAVETDRFMQQLKKEGREQYSIGEYVEKVYNPVMNL